MPARPVMIRAMPSCCFAGAVVDDDAAGGFAAGGGPDGAETALASAAAPIDNANAMTILLKMMAKNTSTVRVANFRTGSNTTPIAEIGIITTSK